MADPACIKIETKLPLHLGMKKGWLTLLVIAPILVLIGFRTNEPEVSAYTQTGEMTRIRLFGHRILLSNGDSSSRVLPVKKIDNTAYRLSFEKPLALVPDSIMEIAYQTLENYPEFAVELWSDNQSELVYSFIISRDSARTIVTCMNRRLPMAKYHLVVRFSGSSSGASFLSKPILIYISIALTLFLSAAIWLWRRKTPAPIQVMQADGLQQADSPFIKLGRIEFDLQRQLLLQNGIATALTQKETQLLTLLAQHPNEVVERARLQKEIWEDQGVIVTRSLDIFVSRLRKKMGAESGVRIVSVHGRGYRLEVEDSK
jgi:hypothetical protein